LGDRYKSLELAYIDQLVQGIIDVCPDYPGSNSSSSQILVPSFFLLILILVLLKCHLVVPFFFTSLSSACLTSTRGWLLVWWPIVSYG
jgi:hypothetical protein